LRYEVRVVWYDATKDPTVSISLENLDGVKQGVMVGDGQTYPELVKAAMAFGYGVYPTLGL
jgi:hypothetical protein